MGQTHDASLRREATMTLRDFHSISEPFGHHFAPVLGHSDTTGAAFWGILQHHLNAFRPFGITSAPPLAAAHTVPKTVPQVLCRIFDIKFSRERQSTPAPPNSADQVGTPASARPPRKNAPDTRRNGLVGLASPGQPPLRISRRIQKRKKKRRTSRL